MLPDGIGGIMHRWWSAGLLLLEDLGSAGAARRRSARALATLSSVLGAGGRITLWSNLALFGWRISGLDVECALDAAEDVHSGGLGCNSSISGDIEATRLPAERVWLALDLLFALVCWLAADKLVLLVNDDDIWSRECRFDCKTTGLDKLDV